MANILSKDQRRTTMGLSRGNWIILFLAICGFIGVLISQAITYGSQVQQQEINTKDIVENRKTIEGIVKDMEKRINGRFDRIEIRQTNRHEELKQLILNNR